MDFNVDFNWISQKTSSPKVPRSIKNTFYNGLLNEIIQKLWYNGNKVDKKPIIILLCYSDACLFFAHNNVLNVITKKFK